MGSPDEEWGCWVQRRSTPQDVICWQQWARIDPASPDCMVCSAVAVDEACLRVVEVLERSGNTPAALPTP